MDDDFLNVGYFRLAKNISKFSDHEKKVGAVLVKKKPISAASNKIKTHPKYSNPDTSIRGSVHAEIRAIINSGCDNLRGASIYVYREHKDGTPAYTRPCSFCLSVLEECGIQTIYYTTESYPFWKKEDL